VSRVSLLLAIQVAGDPGCWRSRAAGRRRSSRPLLALPGSPSPACRLGSGSPSWRSAPSAPASRLVPVATPCQFAAPRTALPRICRGQVRRGAPLPSEPRQRGPAARRCLAAAPLSSSGSGLLPRFREGRLLAQRFSPSRLPHGWALLWPRLTPPRPSDAVADTLLRIARRAEEVSHGKTLHFLGATAGFTRARDRRSIGRPRPSPGCPTALAPCFRRGRLCIRFLFVGSPICLRLPPHPASLRRSCPLFKPGAGFWLAVPLLAARRGLAPPSSMPCVAHDGSRLSPG